jgi:hypothetical protein
MEQSSNLILLLLKDCSDSIDPQKCKLSICKYNEEIQYVLIDLISKFSSITMNPSKQQYNFLPFMLTNSLAAQITSNSVNKHKDGTYFLCNIFSVKPPDPNSPTFSSFQDLKKDAVILQQNNNQNVLIGNIIIFLQYFAIAIVIITILIVIYNKYIKTHTETILKKVGGYFSKRLNSN